MNFRQVATAALLTAAAMLMGATPAMAHAELIASDPAEGAAMPAPPARVQLTFNEPVTPAPNVVEIVGPGNATWTVGAPTVAGAVITVPVQPTGPAGAYTMTYRVVSGDGDPVSGSVRFTLITAATTTTPPTATSSTTPTTPPPASPSPSPAAAQPASEDDGGIPVWVWIVGAAVLVAVGVGVALRPGRAKG